MEVISDEEVDNKLRLSLCEQQIVYSRPLTKKPTTAFANEWKGAECDITQNWINKESLHRLKCRLKGIPQAL